MDVGDHDAAGAANVFKQALDEFGAGVSVVSGEKSGVEYSA